MQLGALLPLGDIGGDPSVVREFAQTAESIGYDFLEGPDHVLGSNPASAPEPERTGAACFMTRSSCSAISRAARLSSISRPAS